MDDKTGGPAFPKQPIWRTPDGYSVEMQQDGMTLRDYFAAKAMQGILGGVHPITRASDCEVQIGRAAYAIADAMLAERAK